MDIDPKTIQPEQRGESDFFSWQLFRWMRKDRRFCEVWQWPDGQLYIGHSDNNYNEPGKGWLHGKKLRGLCSYGQDLGRFAVPIPSAARDITADFWADYMKRGVCAIHGDLVHEWNDTGGGIRHCEYCGKIEHRRVEMRPVEIWEGV